MQSIQIINKKAKPPWELIPSFEEITLLIRSNNIEIAHVVREENQAADALAKACNGLDHVDSEKIHEFPQILQGIIELEKDGVAYLRNGRIDCI